MQEIRDNYPFFKDCKNISFIAKQDENKMSKLFLNADGECFTLIREGREDNARLAETIEFLRASLPPDYLPEILHIDKSRGYFVTSFVGGENAKSLFALKNNGYEINIEKLSDELYSLARAVHNIPIPDDVRGQNWHQTIMAEFDGYFDFFQKLDVMGDGEFDVIKALLEKIRPYSERVRTCYIHDDFTAKNVCYDPQAEKLFLIDWDTIKIADPNIDISKSITHSFGHPVFLHAAEKFYPNFDRDVCYFYGLRVSLFWLKSLYDRLHPEFTIRVAEFKDRLKNNRPSAANK